jgi:hypothetical protein
MTSSRHEDDILLYGLKDTLLHVLIRWVRVELNVAKLAMERLSSIDLCDCLVIVIKGCCQIVVDFLRRDFSEHLGYLSRDLAFAFVDFLGAMNPIVGNLFEILKFKIFQEPRAFGSSLDVSI